MSSLQQMIGIISIEEFCRIQALGDGTFDGCAVHNATRCSGWSVCAIGAGTQHDNLIDTLELDRCGQCKFLIPSAEPVPSYRDRRFTAAEDARRSRNWRVVCGNFF